MRPTNEAAMNTTTSTLNSTNPINSSDLDFLRHNPQFQQLRQVVQQQPQMLEPILQQVGAGNPQLAQMIASNPESFLQLLAEEADEANPPLPPGAQAISVTEEEREAIERLCRLGFERDIAIQAYFACDKNEELAVNFLFDQVRCPVLRSEVPPALTINFYCLAGRGRVSNGSLDGL